MSGPFELLGATGLLFRPTRRAAGVGLFLLMLAVMPAVYVLQRPELFAAIPLGVVRGASDAGRTAGTDRVVHGPRLE